MFDKHYVGRHITAFEDNRKKRPISRVTLMVDDESALTAGDDTGMELLASCPHATQGMVDAILAQVKGYEYHMYSGDAAEIDPAAELGDGVSVNGIYSVISRMSEGGRGYTGLSAPGEPEMEDEYPVEGPMTTEFNRKIAETRSTITKTAEEIRLEVENELEGLSASFSVQLNSITSRVDGLDGAFAELKVTVDGVTVTDSSGTTRIKGSSVETTTLYVSAANITDKLTANQIDATNLQVNAANITGSLRVGQLPDDAALLDDIPTDISELNNDEGYQTERGVVDLIDGTVTADYVNALGISASYLQGRYIYLLDRNKVRAGRFSVTDAATADSAIDLTSYGALRFTAQVGDVYLLSGSGSNIQLSGEVVLGGGDTRPDDVTRTCGTADAFWSDVYTENDPVVVSDLTKKKEVVYDLSAYEPMFDALKPMSFLFVDGDSGRRHIGLGAQDVLDVLTGAGLTTQDFAGFVAAPKRDEAGQLIGGEYDYFLRYGEFIPLCIDQIQKLKKRVSALEGTA